MQSKFHDITMDSKTPFNKDNGTKISFSDSVELIGATCEYKQKTPRMRGLTCVIAEGASKRPPLYVLIVESIPVFSGQTPPEG